MVSERQVIEIMYVKTDCYKIETKYNCTQE